MYSRMRTLLMSCINGGRGGGSFAQQSDLDQHRSYARLGAGETLVILQAASRRRSDRKHFRILLYLTSNSSTEVPM